MSEYELPPSIRPATDPIRLKGGHTTRDPRLDRLVEFDPRSLRYPVRELLSAAEQTPRSYTWRCSSWLDQGAQGACTGFSITHEAIARPTEVQNLTEDIAREVYYRARVLDEWPGESYEGSSVIAATKAAQELGWYDEYRWAFGLSDLVLAVGRKGPAVLGVPWYTGMFEADDKGLIHVDGEVAGGHAILCNGVSVRKRRFRLHNSWGQGWGQEGDAYISWDDMERLLAEDGEAMIPVGRKRP